MYRKPYTVQDGSFSKFEWNVVDIEVRLFPAESCEFCYDIDEAPLAI